MNQFGDAYKKLEALGDRERVLAVWPDYERCEGCGNAISKGPQGWVHEDSDQMGCERAFPAVAEPANAMEQITQPTKDKWPIAPGQVAEPARGVPYGPTGKRVCYDGVPSHPLTEPNPPQPAKPEAFEEWWNSTHPHATAVVRVFAREAWQAALRSRQGESEPSNGKLFCDDHGYIFLQTLEGPTMFAEIRGFGAGLPQDANAQRLCDLWNVAQSAPAGSHGLKESWDVWNMTGPQSTQWDELEDSDRARWAKAIAASAPAGWEDWEVAAFNEGVDTAVEYVDSSGLIGNDFRRQIVIEIGALKRTAPKPAQEPSR